MDKYIKKLRDIVQSSCKEIKVLKEKQKRNLEIYVDDEAVKQNKVIDDEINGIVETSRTKIEELRTEILDKIQKYCVLNSKDITDDINLFNGAFDFTIEELNSYIEKYKSNYTMTNAILKHIREKGLENKEENKMFFIDLKTKLITKEDKEKCYNDFCDSAISLVLNETAQSFHERGARYDNQNGTMHDFAVEKFGDEETISPRYISILESCKGY